MLKSGQIDLSSCPLAIGRLFLLRVEKCNPCLRGQRESHVSPPPKLTPAGIVLLAMFACFAPGCFWKNDRLPVNRVGGSVFVVGKPAVGAKLFFHPVDAGFNPRALRPFAEVAEDGTFELSTYLADDGAPEGDYVVTIYWPAPKKLFKGKFEDDSLAPDRLKDLYSNPRTSKLRAHINCGDNLLPPFELPDVGKR